MLPLALLASVVAFWIHRGWRWRWLAVVGLGSCAALLLLVLGWGDAREPTDLARRSIANQAR